MPTNHPGFDLNLMRVLVAVFEEGSATQAAERLNVAQPTISYGLGKLRRVYADPLFVRGPGRLVPTAACEKIYQSFSAALKNVQASLLDRSTFDPRTAQRRIRLVMSDIGELYFTPRLLDRFKDVAPNVELEVLQFNDDGLIDDLAFGRVDAAIGNLPSMLTSTRNASLFKEHYVCLLSARHPHIGKTLSVKAFNAARHIMVTSPFSRHSAVDESLEQQGISRRIAVRIPHFTVLPTLVATSELLATLPSRIANIYAADRRLRVLNLPVPSPTFEVRVHWHPRQETDPFHTWLIAEIIKALGRG